MEKNGEAAPYIFTAEMYYRDEDATELPWNVNFSTWDNAHSIYFYDDAAVFDTWSKVGIQSIYYGNGERRESDIVWGDNPTTGISDIQTANGTAPAVYFNFAGQRLNAPRKGLNIINGRKVIIK